MSQADLIRTVKIVPGGSAVPGSRQYECVIGAGLLSQVRARAAAILGKSGSAFLLADNSLPDSLIASMSKDVLGQAATVVRWEPTEAAKSPAQAIEFLQSMAAARLDRSSFVIALGGGITGDMAGFLAAIYQRGIPWVNCPTTLLGMVDASIGGKTGINLEVPGSAPLKNFVGAIHHPILVVSDVTTLQTLPDRQFRSGLAECAKHTMIAADWGSPDLNAWTLSDLPRILHRHPETLIDLIARNLKLKATVVAADEREEGRGPGGGRMSLNLGHTFAHAIETLPGVLIADQPSPIQHGEAVGLGLIAAATCAAALGLTDASTADETRALIRACGLPTAVLGLPLDDQIILRMTQDKKARGGTLRLVLPCGPGRVQVVDNPPLAAVRAGLAAIRA